MAGMVDRVSREQVEEELQQGYVGPNWGVRVEELGG